MTEPQPDSVEGVGDQASVPSQDQASPQGIGEETPSPQDVQSQEGEGAEGSEPKGNAPEYGEFTLPDGVEINQELLAQANPVFKELGLSQEQAQKLVDFESSRQQAQVEQFHQQIQTWQEETRNDKEIGGDQMDRTISQANKAINAYFEPGFIDALRATGLTNHPEVIRGLARIANKHLTEDNPGGGNPPSNPKSRTEILYGTD